MAWAEGQFFEFSDPNVVKKAWTNANELVTELDSPELAEAKLLAVANGKRLYKRLFVWSALAIMGGIIGAACGYGAGFFLGLPVQ